MMTVCAKARSLILLVAVAASAACGRPEDRVADQTNTTADEPARASADQRRAAQLLSLSGSASETERSGYEGSIACAASLGIFMESVASSPLIDEAQVNALKQANQLFRTRARDTGSAEGKSRQQVNADISRATDDARDDPTESSRTAIGCIRGLAGEAQRSERVS